MSERMIRSVIGNTSLNLDPETIADVINFITTFVGDGSKIQIVKIYACTAIVCECKKIPSVSAESLVSTGLTIEKIMNCVSDIPKEQFFSLLYLIASKWPRCPNSLYHKIDTLKTSYRAFKKYRLLCQTIGKQVSLSENVNSLLSSFGWLIYLISMMKEDQIGRLEIVPDILTLLIIQIYVNYLQLVDEQYVLDIVSNSFPHSSLTPHIKDNLLNRYRHRYSSIINQVYQMRGYNKPIQQFIIRPQILQRLIDDLSSEYAKLKETEYSEAIDEASFLGLSKTLTPQAFRFRRFQQIHGPITERLKFQGERMSQFHSHQLLQNKVEREKIIPLQTPLSTKLQSLAWIRSCIQSLSVIEIQRAKACYEHFRQQSYEEFLQQVSQKLDIAISAFTPTCRDFNHRKTQIFKFFTCCIISIIQMYGQSDLKEIYQSTDSVFSILSLCTQIFNFCYQARVGDYKEYCDIFGISLSYGFEPINWFGRFLKLPFGVSEHLFDLQRRLLIKQVWQNEIGLLKEEHIDSSHDQKIKNRIEKRLYYHIKQRIRNICDDAMENYQTQKIFKIMQLLITQQPTYIAHNNIDKIIICCITSTLCLHKNHHQSDFKIIQQVVDQYRKIPFSFQTNLTTVDTQTGKKTNIVQYYNQSFLPILQQVLGQGKQSAHFETPKKIQVIQWDNEGTTQHTNGFISNPKTDSAFLKKQNKNGSASKNLQRKLVANIFKSTGHPLFNQMRSESSEMIDESEEGSGSGSS